MLCKLSANLLELGDRLVPDPYRTLNAVGRTHTNASFKGKSGGICGARLQSSELNMYI